MRYYLVAGEASGDLHGANLIRAIRREDPHAEFRFFGGDLMQAAGENLVMHYRNMAYMGLFAVLANFRTIARNMILCRQDILNWQPEVLILIDFPGFNLRLAEFAKKQGIRTVYYISPKIWAWKSSRIHKIKAFIDRMFVILPFEVDYYKQRGYEVEYFGNPVLDAVTTHLEGPADEKGFRAKNKLDSRPIIAILPGSRKQEISMCLPYMLRAASSFQEYQMVVAKAPSIPSGFYETYTKLHSVHFVEAQTYELLRYSRAAVVVSGTATLETALIGTPQVVIYRTSPLTYHIGKHVVKVKFFSLPNIIMDKEIVKELLQEHLEDDIRRELNKILPEGDPRAKMMNYYSQLRDLMGEPGVSGRVARSINSFIQSKQA